MAWLLGSPGSFQFYTSSISGKMWIGCVYLLSTRSLGVLCQHGGRCLIFLVEDIIIYYISDITRTWSRRLNLFIAINKLFLMSKHRVFIWSSFVYFVITSYPIDLPLSNDWSMTCLYLNVGGWQDLYYICRFFQYSGNKFNCRYIYYSHHFYLFLSYIFSKTMTIFFYSDLIKSSFQTSD